MGQERALSYCSDPYCPLLKLEVPQGKRVVCVGKRLKVCSSLHQKPGCYRDREYWYDVKDRTWEVIGFGAEPSSGRGSCAVFTTMGEGCGYVEFKARGEVYVGLRHCEQEVTRRYPVCSCRLTVELGPGEYLPLDGFDLAEHQERALRATDGDLAPVTVWVRPSGLPGLEWVEVYGENVYEDEYKRREARKRYWVGELPKRLYVEGRRSRCWDRG